VSAAIDRSGCNPEATRAYVVPGTKAAYVECLALGDPDTYVETVLLVGGDDDDVMGVQVVSGAWMDTRIATVEGKRYCVIRSFASSPSSKPDVEVYVLEGDAWHPLSKWPPQVAPP
jgi:hypothetical protein